MSYSITSPSLFKGQGSLPEPEAMLTISKAPDSPVWAPPPELATQAEPHVAFYMSAEIQTSILTAPPSHHSRPLSPF